MMTLSIKKKAKYKRITEQLTELFVKTENPAARMATISAILHNKFNYFFWTGFYLLDNGELTVGPYQGSLACLVLKKHTGVCWAGVDTGKTVIVEDVHKFPGHIACDCRSNSEIVVPLRDKTGLIIGVLDIDSEKFSTFDEVDGECLEKIVNLIYG